MHERLGTTSPTLTENQVVVCGEFGMAPDYLFCFLLFSHLILIFSARYGNGYQDNCPRSFMCGNLGTFQYPFTKAEHQDCGLLPIHNCDNVNARKRIQLEKNGRSYALTGTVHPNNIISIFDEDFHKRFQIKTCDSLNNNLTLVPSPSPLVSIYIKYNVTLFRCNHNLSVRPPAHYFQHRCPDYDIYYDGNPSPNKDEARSIFSACSVLQLPTKDVADTKDLQSFVSAQMVIEVLLSDDCDECYNHKGGQCRLDTDKNFHCYKGTL